MANPEGDLNQRKQAVTLADVARHAGVSAMTVSRVVNGEQAVKAATRERVLAAIADLKYISSQAARRIAETEPIRIGLLYSNPSAGYLSEFLIGLINEATSSSAQLAVEWVDQHRGVASVDPFLASGLDAVIIAPPLGDCGALVDSVLERGLAAMLVAPGRPCAGVSSVGVDHFGAAMKMTQHLIALGHQRIGFITGSATHSATECRLRGFRSAMREARLATPDDFVVPGLFTYDSGLSAAETLLSRPSRPTAVFASNDDMASATVTVAHRLGLDVPGDLTVVGCDDTPIATSSRPELTTIRQPIRLMAASAVNLLVRQVQARRAGEPFAAEVVHMDCDLIRRQSDAAPRKRASVAASPRAGALTRG
ncbi:MAG: LacI family DNA-binding transcriptional regulator [Rubrivivax sp.]|nr:MAG: LacI family DNA-binding transcriptional regulator [Rubrivivax sp.]